MTITLELAPEVEKRLREAADRQGQPVEDDLIHAAEREVARAENANFRFSTEEGAYPPGSLAEMFAQWQEEDATDDPEELARRDRELEELKANLNANRAACGEEPLFL